jgi:hypothetical protein
MVVIECPNAVVEPFDRLRDHVPTNVGIIIERPRLKGILSIYDHKFGIPTCWKNEGAFPSGNT